MNFPNIPSGGPGGGDNGARAAGFNDYSDYLNKKAQANRGESSGASNSSSGGSTDPIALAKAAQAMQLEANQPAIATLGQAKTDLATQYKDLLDSITQAEQPALNSVIGAANTNLAKRGITSDSAYGAMNIAQAQQPIATQFGQLKSQTGLSEQQDLNTLASQIASLQAGNVQGGLTFGSGVNTAAQGLAAAQAQADAQVKAAQAQPFTALAPGQATLNKATGVSALPSFLS